MPGPPMKNPAVAGLAAATPDELIAQRMGVNQKMAGATGQGQLQMAPPRPTATPGSIHLNPATPDPSGMLAALQQAGYTGQRTADIGLPDEPQSVDELTRRIDALMRR